MDCDYFLEFDYLKSKPGKVIELLLLNMFYPTFEKLGRVI